MAANALCVARPSTAVILTMHDKQVLVFLEERCQAPAPSQCWEIIRNAIIYFHLRKKLQQDKGLKYPVIHFNSSSPGQNGRHIGRRQFQINFLEWKWWNSDSNFTEICSQEFNWQKASIGSGNGLVPKRWQAITWTNAHTVHWCIYAALGRVNPLFLLVLYSFGVI